MKLKEFYAELAKVPYDKYVWSSGQIRLKHFIGRRPNDGTLITHCDCPITALANYKIPKKNGLQWTINQWELARDELGISLEDGHVIANAADEFRNPRTLGTDEDLVICRMKMLTALGLEEHMMAKVKRS